jgi:hypothetical protein
MYQLPEDDATVKAAVARFDRTWDGLRFAVDAALKVGDRPDIPPAFAMAEALEETAQTDDEKLIAAAFFYNLDDEEDLTDVVKGRVRVLYEMLARLELDPVMLKKKLNDSK